MSEDQKSVHEKFNAVFKALGTNAYQVSKRLGLSRPDKYYKIEKGQAKPSFETLSEIIQLYPQVNVNYYFKDDVPMFEEEMNLFSQASDVQNLRIKHLEQKIAMLEAQNQELIQRLENTQNK
ncbi:DNA-binding XRE family transcriptional regulator [Catalinimonas alkaloidigena]|jgi:DNA-binding XRE family transcriptional regulator|uniref:helix-turn-helix domain-containing protein n=1 Tax=Catalinimonas TaxID=1522128 RepID=UPI0024071913|nr:helix-turn-helix transcriptional regulator [Catalinimonas alkaloidigena]MDF9799092.1 DNA-binding XRE family transcriptional regulator [Catalinimonas alkaloidigena]